MFENKKEKDLRQDKNIDPEKMSNEINAIVNQEVGKGREIQVDDDAVYVMPAKFLPQSPKSQFSTKQKIIFAGIAFVLFLIIVVAAMLWWANSSVNLPQNNDNQNTLVPTNNTNQNQEPIVPEQTVSHDQKILDDLQDLKTVLDLYFRDFQAYPAYLSDLRPDYLAEIPTQESGLFYQYQSISNANNFRFVVELDGSENPSQIGFYQFTKTGLSIYDPNNSNSDNPNDNQNNENEQGTVLPPPPPPPTSNNVDTDQDLLTREEESLFGTNPNDSDTDNDGYNDGTEIMNLYNPLVSSQGLADSGLVTIFTNQELNYRLLYPSSWIASLLDDQYNNLSILANSELGDNFSILVLENPENLDLQAWANSAPNNENFSNLNSTTLGKNKIPALKTEVFGDLFILAVSDNYRLLISYDVNAEADRYFDTTFQMILNSFEFINE
ncbi:hypothetical protein H6761_00410 [Candidatus Nomurabacteria bacterium]|nr:hypothetical protein [Candidatus Nomurabacteria bacterium]